MDNLVFDIWLDSLNICHGMIQAVDIFLLSWNEFSQLTVILNRLNMECHDGAVTVEQCREYCIQDKIC